MATYATWRGGGTYSAIVVSGGLDTKGSYTEVSASTSFNSSKCWVGNNGSTAGNVYLYDIATGAAASETVRVDNVMICGPSLETYGAGLVQLEFDIASGTRIAARCQSSTSGADQIAMWILQENRATASLPDPETYGITTATTEGVTVDPGAVADTKGAYAEITASTAADHDVFLIMVGNNANTAAAATNWNMDLASGAGGAESIIVPDLSFVCGTASDTVLPSVTRVELAISSGTRLAARSMCGITDATDRLFMVSLIGMDTVATGGGGASAYAFA